MKKIQGKRTAWVRGSGIVQKSNGKEIIILFISHSGTKMPFSMFLLTSQGDESDEAESGKLHLSPVCHHVRQVSAARKY